MGYEVDKLFINFYTSIQFLMTVILELILVFFISDAITGTTITDMCVYEEPYIGDTYCDDALNIVCTQLLNSIQIGGFLRS